MIIDPMTKARARMAVREAARDFLFDPNVNLIDFGHPIHNGRLAENELAIRFHVLKKMSGIELENATRAGVTHQIPDMVREFQTDVPEARYRLQPGWGMPVTNARAARLDPLYGGVSISDEYRIAYGTLGGFVQDRQSGEPMLLSNWHVLSGNAGLRQGVEIYQPGRMDGGGPQDSIAQLDRDGMASNLDAAAATLLGNRQFASDQFGLGVVRGVSQAELGMRLAKSGRGSGITEGMVTAVEGIAKINYGYVERIIRHVVTIDPVTGGMMVSAPGDSGSWWMDEDTMEVVGLHFAGSNSPETALALDMQTVLDALNVDVILKVGVPVRSTGYVPRGALVH